MRVVKWSLLILALTQLPFAWGLYQTRQVEAFLSAPRPWRVMAVPFLDLPGCVHVHSEQGGHSLGTYQQIVDAAKEAGLRYLFITEHPHQPPVLAEIEDPNLIIVYGIEEKEEGEEFQVLRDRSRAVRFLSHFSGQDVPPGYDGIEIYNLHENAAARDTWFNRTSFLYHQLYRPELFFFRIWALNEKRIALWDRAQAIRPVSGIAGNDAHQNVGVILETTAGQRLFSVMVDPYEYSFRFVSTHVMLPLGNEPTRDSILHALASGSAYVCFDRLGDAKGFSFHAIRKSGAVSPMGSTVPAGVDLVFQAPTPVRFRLFRSGSLFRELDGVRFTFEHADPGTYRVEVFPLNPPPLLRNKPWIVSNPIHVRP